MVVHNAGVTRDRTIAKMPEDRWSELMEINLASEERINDALLSRGLLAEQRADRLRLLDVGIAGNSGQTNYATSKAGVIGMVRSAGAGGWPSATRRSTRSRPASSRRR